MNSDPTESNLMVEPETPSKTPRHNIFYRVRRYGSRKFPSLIPNPDLLEILRVSREGDEKENSRTEPPSDEIIDLKCIWAVEFYTPSQVGQLLRGFEKLGWNTDDSLISQRNPTVWLQRFREAVHGGGWFNLGPIQRPGGRGSFGIERTAPLPSEVEYALAAMYGLTSSITCIVIGFIVNQKYSERLDESLRRTRQTILLPHTGGGYRISNPSSQKAADIRAIRAELRESAASWFCTHLPGIFASGLLEGEFPTCEFLTLRKTDPFPKASQQDKEAEGWLRLLGLDNDTDTWGANRLPGLKFTWPVLRDEKSRFHAIVAAKEDSFPTDELRGYGGGNRPSYVMYVDRRVNSLLSRWAILCMLSGFEHRLNNLRDSATFKPAQHKRALHFFREVGGYVSQSMDITAASKDLSRFAEDALSFGHDLEIFHPSNPSLYRDESITFDQGVRKQLQERSMWLEGLDRSVRNLLIQYGSILGLHENIKLQKRMGRQTSVMVILTVVIAALTALTAYLAAKAGHRLWPW